MTRLIRWLALPAALLAAGLMASPAGATIVITAGNGPAKTNVGAYEQTGPVTADGFELGGGPLLLTALTDTELTVPAMGSARIEAAGVPFSTVSYFAPAGMGFTAFEANPRIPSQGDEGDFLVIAFDQFG